MRQTDKNSSGIESKSSSALSITSGTDTKMRSSHWSITINNPTSEDLDAWRNMKSHHWVKDVQGQLEQGENGTPHIQGYLRTDQVRFSQIKKILPRAHIEVAKNPTALVNYVTKEETRVATIAHTKVASPHTVQTYLYDIVMTDLIQNDFPILWNYPIVVEKYETPKRVWTPEQMEWDDLHGDTSIERTVYLLKMNELYIRASSDKFIDTAVSRIIEDGYYGIEFAIANNQVRNGYKKYLCSILIRHASCPPPEPPSTSSPQGEEANDTTPSSLE